MSSPHNNYIPAPSISILSREIYQRLPSFLTQSLGGLQQIITLPTLPLSTITPDLEARYGEEGDLDRQRLSQVHPNMMTAPIMIGFLTHPNLEPRPFIAFLLEKQIPTGTTQQIDFVYNGFYDDLSHGMTNRVGANGNVGSTDRNVILESPSIRIYTFGDGENHMISDSVIAAERRITQLINGETIYNSSGHAFKLASGQPSLTIVAAAQPAPPPAASAAPT